MEIVKNSLSKPFQKFTASINRLIPNDLGENLINAVGGEDKFIEHHVVMAEGNADTGIVGLTSNEDILALYRKERDSFLLYGDEQSACRGYDSLIDLFLTLHNSEEQVYSVNDIVEAIELEGDAITFVEPFTTSVDYCLMDFARFLVFNSYAVFASEYAGLLSEGEEAYYLDNIRRGLSIEDYEY